MGDDIYRLGLLEKKKKELEQLRAIINSHKQSLDILYINNKFHPERLKLSDIKILTDQWIKTIAEYQDLFGEIQEL